MPWESLRLFSLPGLERVDLSFIIVNYFNSRTLAESLDSIYKTVSGLKFEVMVVNNSRQDRELPGIEANFPQARFIHNTHNVGFARANNQAARMAVGTTLVFMNPDSVLTPGCMGEMFAYLQSHPEVGVLGPKVLNLDGSIQFSCRAFPTVWSGLFNRYSLLTRLFPNNRFSRQYLMTDFDHNEIRTVDWVSGCFMMIAKHVFQDVGEFDENFFLFIEDIDLCQAMKNKGYRVVYYPPATIFHHVTSSNGKTAAGTIIKRHRGMSYYNQKHRQGNVFSRSAISILISLRCLSQLALNLFK